MILTALAATRKTTSASTANPMRPVMTFLLLHGIDQGGKPVCVQHPHFGASFYFLVRMQRAGRPELPAAYPHHALASSLYLLSYHSALARDPPVSEVPLSIPEREPVQEGGTQDDHAENRGREEPYGLDRDAESKQGGHKPHDSAEREEEQEERDGKKLTDEGKGRQRNPENDLPIHVSRLLA